MTTRHEKLRRDHIRILSSFKQHDWETLGETWMRMKDMLEIYCCHGFDKEKIKHIFYFGLNDDTRYSLECESEGFFIDKPANMAFQILEERSLLSLNWSTIDSSHSSSNLWRENPNPYQDNLGLNSLKFKFLQFIAHMDEINESWYKQIDDLELVMHQNFENNESSIQRIDEKLRLIELEALQNDIQPNLKTTPPASDKYLSSTIMNEHINVDIAIISNNLYSSNVNNESITNHGMLVQEPVEDDFTDDEMEDEESVLTPELVKDNFEDDKTLDEQLQELLNDDLVDYKNENIKAEELDKIVEMSIDEFREWIEKPPLDESNDELKREVMLETTLEEPPASLELELLPSNLEYVFLPGKSPLPVVISFLLPVMIQTISAIIVLSPIVEACNELLIKKLDKTSLILLDNKYSDHKNVVIDDWVIKKIKFEYYSPFNFRPPDISNMGMPEISNLNENVTNSIKQTYLSNIPMKNFSKEFMEPNDLLWNKIALESKSLKLPCSKEDEYFNLHFQIKEFKNVVHHMLRLPTYNCTLCHLWLGNIRASSKFNYCHPHFNSSVGESPITCK